MNMGKWKKSYSETRKYNKNWELEYEWVTCRNGSAHCVSCDHSFKVLKKHNLQIHENTMKHKKHSINTTVIKTQAEEIINETTILDGKEEIIDHAETIISTTPLSMQEFIPACELRFCCSIVCHCNMKEIDHISNIVNLYSKSNELKNLELNLSRSKCLVIIRNILNVAILEEVMSDLQNSLYSLLIEEVTYSSSSIYVCICVKYFSPRHERLKTQFLGLIPVSSSTGESIFSAIETFLQSHYIDLKNCIGFSFDGGNVCASNSIFSRLKDLSPNIIYVKCSCHSLELCCEDAMKKLPSNIEYLIAEIARWFKFSTLRKDEYNALFLAMNAGFIKSCEYVTPNNIRWLVKGKCINAIVSQWHDLRAYFNVVAHEEHSYQAKIINEMLNNVLNYLYLTFILPIVEEFDGVNAAFQACNADVKKVFKDLDLLCKSMHDKMQNFFLGAKFQKTIDKANLSEADQNEVKQKCMNFVVEANAQLEKRRSKIDYGILNLKMFHPSEYLNTMTPFEEIPKSFLTFAKRNENFIRLETQYGKVLQINWAEEFPDETIPDDSIKFWAFVKKYENALGERPFEILADTVLSAFAFPLSNSCVEHIFSQVTNVTRKLRSESSMQTLEAVLRIRTYFESQNMCCNNFFVTPKMQDLFAQNLFQTHTISIDGIGISYSIPPPTSTSDDIMVNEEEDLEDIIALPF